MMKVGVVLLVGVGLVLGGCVGPHGLPPEVVSETLVEEVAAAEVEVREEMAAVVHAPEGLRYMKLGGVVQDVRLGDVALEGGGLVYGQGSERLARLAEFGLGKVEQRQDGSLGLRQSEGLTLSQAQLRYAFSHVLRVPLPRLPELSVTIGEEEDGTRALRRFEVGIPETSLRLTHEEDEEESVTGVGWQRDF